MDVFVSCSLSKEDLSGVLRTIVLFLDSLKLTKTSEALKKECETLGLDVSFDAKQVLNQASSSEKAVNSSIFETTEATSSINSLNVYYSNATTFQTSSEKCVVRPEQSKELNRSNKANASTCHPICENVGIQYDEAQLEGVNNKPPRVCSGGTLLSGPAVPQNGSGITAELVKALQSSISGQSERFLHLKEKCREVYPDLFVLMQNKDEITAGSSKELDVNKDEAGSVYLKIEPRTSDVKLEMKRSISDTCLERRTYEGAEIVRKESSKSLEDMAFSQRSMNGDYEKQTTDIAEPFQQTAVQQKHEALSTTSGFFDIDYGKLKADLINGNEKRKMLILQALRWRITKQSTEIRENVMDSYIKRDLLCLQAPYREKLVFLEPLYCPKAQVFPNPVQESIARLVNTFASLSAGRDYLCQYDNVLTHLLLPLILDKHHSCTKLGSTARDMVLATLQKLSLRFHARQKMISSGLTEFLIGFLNENHASVSVYCLEYCTALLMNLCLHKEGRCRCMGRCRDVMRLIKNLLNSKSAENVMPYVSGTMYSLLGNRKINMEAKLMDLASLLRYHIKHTADGENRRQLEYILKIHLEGGSIKHPDPKLEGEELDLLEPELEEDDLVKGEISGEDVLADYRVETLTDHDKRQEMRAPIIQEDPFRNIPLTPRPRTVSTTRTEASERQPPNCPCPSTISEETVIKQEIYVNSTDPIVEENGPPTSPDESFSEVTKQFYHKPSKKKGIFDRNKLKITKNPYQPKPADLPNPCFRNPEGERGSEQNFPCRCGYRPCEYGHQNSNKYTCCCYEAMKAFIDNNSLKEKCDSCSQTSPCARNEASKDGVPQFTGAERNGKSSNSENLCNVMLEVQTLEGSSHKVCNKTCLVEEGANCGKCYNVIFQSRPRIVRTPP